MSWGLSLFTLNVYLLLVREMRDIAPMLQTLGYDPNMNPPNYGEADKQIVINTNQIVLNKEYWKVKKKQLLEEMEKTIPAVD